MELISPAEAAKKWNVPLRFVEELCRQNAIDGVVRVGEGWKLPDAADFPERSMPYHEAQSVSFAKCGSFLLWTDFYHTPGTVDARLAELAMHDRSAILWTAEITLARGDFETAFRNTRRYLEKNDDFAAELLGGSFLASCSIWRGDIALWQEAQCRISSLSCQTEKAHDFVSLALISSALQVGETAMFPDWFTHGCLERLHPDLLPAARVLYVQYLVLTAFHMAVEFSQQGHEKKSAMLRALPYLIEPMIAQSIADKAVLSELYLHASCATVYHHIGDRDRANEHIDRLIALALPDELYGALASFRWQLDTLLDGKLAAVSTRALSKVRELSKLYVSGWAKLCANLFGREICTNLAPREREVARLAAFGFTNRQIASQLQIAESTVKQAIRSAIGKSGVRDRDELGRIL